MKAKLRSSSPKSTLPLRTLYMRTSPADTKLLLVSQGIDPLESGNLPLYSIQHGTPGKRKATLYHGPADPEAVIGDMAVSLYTSTSKLSIRGDNISLKLKMFSGDFLVESQKLETLTWKGYNDMPQKPLEFKDKSGHCLARFICIEQERPRLEIMAPCDEWLAELMLLSAVAVFELHKIATKIVGNTGNTMVEAGVEETTKIGTEALIGALVSG